MKIGTKLIHRVTGIEYKFVKQLGPHCIVENADGRKSFSEAILHTTANRQHPGRKGYCIGDKVWVQIDGTTSCSPSASGATRTTASSSRSSTRRRSSTCRDLGSRSGACGRVSSWRASTTRS